jgi:HEPN domain-containing protein
MRNSDLAEDYVKRSAVRLMALEVLFDAGSWADVVRESQELVELALKGLLLSSGIEAPRIHDVSEILAQERERLPEQLRGEVERLGRISKQLRRDRELAFYGSEDLTPSNFYKREDAAEAREGAATVVRLVKPFVARADR